MLFPIKELTESVPIYGSGGWTNLTEQELLEEMNSYVSQGISRVKFKVAKDFGRSERQDLQRLAAVRNSLGDDRARRVLAKMNHFVSSSSLLFQS